MVFAFPLRGQAPSANFTAPAAACLQANVPLTNQSLNSVQYLWDFCDQDLATVNSMQLATTVTNAVTPLSIRAVYEKGNWFGFVASRDNDKLFRCDFGNSLDNNPAIVDLGNPGNALSQPGNIEFAEEGGVWFGFVANRGNGSIVRLQFTTGLASNPVISDLGNLGMLSSTADIEVVKDGANWVMISTNYANNLIQVVSFGGSLTNSPAHVRDISNGLLLNPYGLQVEKNAGLWYAFAVASGGNGIVRITFGNGLLTTPTSIGLVYNLVGATDASLDLEGATYRMYVSTTGGDLHYVDFGTSLSGAPVLTANLGRFGVVNNTYGFSVARTSPDWRGFAVDYSSKKIYRYSFVGTCTGVSTLTSSAVTPTGIIYSQSGSYNIDLTAFSVDGSMASVNKSITVSALTAPDINFTSTNNCSANPIAFSSVNLSGGLTTYAWDFGDSQSSNTPNPSNTYASAGTYEVGLTVTGSNGCTNFASNPVSVYNIPTASFSFPAVSPVCTNQNYTLNNTTTVDPGSNPTWEWRLNGNLVSTQQQYAIQFSSASSQEIRLKAKLMGCENEMISTVPVVVTGPLISFSVADNCVNSTIPFTNTSTGTVSSYQWSFGDGVNSSATSPTHQYASAAAYMVTLTGTNPAGCVNFATMPISVYSLPQPDFAVGLPPFSCANSPTLFQNNTPPLTDSNISDWSWDFGDGGVSTTQIPQHNYANAGVFSPTLTATSDKGCMGITTKPIVIADSPLSGFSMGPSCLNQSTKFTDMSTGDVQSRLWQIGSSMYTSQNPSHTFVVSGNYTATLTTTSSNGCVSVAVQPVVIPVPPTVDFTSSNLCAGKDALFSDNTVSIQDAVVGWGWNFDGNSMTGNPALYNFSPSGIYNVKLTTTHASGCKYTLSRNVGINPSPTAAFSASPDRGEPPLTIQFTNASQQATSYLWRFFDNTIATSTAASPVYTFLTLGDYSVELTAFNSFGCSDVLTLPVYALESSIDLVLLDYVLATDPLTGNTQNIVTILNSSNVPVSSADVALHLSDKAIVNETLHLNLAPGDYVTKTLSFTLSPNQFDATFLCAEVLAEKDVQSDDNKKCISLDQDEYFFNPYPNPTSGPLQIDWVASEPGTTGIVIYDNYGKRTSSFEVSGVVGLNQAVLDVSSLGTGLYFVVIRTLRSQKTLRFVRN
jgi:PKD repeat protein